MPRERETEQARIFADRRAEVIDGIISKKFGGRNAVRIEELREAMVIAFDQGARVTGTMVADVFRSSIVMGVDPGEVL